MSRIGLDKERVLQPGSTLARSSFSAHSRKTQRFQSRCQNADIYRQTFPQQISASVTTQIGSNWEIVWTPRAKEMKQISIFMKVFSMWPVVLAIQHNTCYWSCRETFAYLCTMKAGCIMNRDVGRSSIRVCAYSECKSFCMSVKDSLRRGKQQEQQAVWED